MRPLIEDVEELERDLAEADQEIERGPVGDAAALKSERDDARRLLDMVRTENMHLKAEVERLRAELTAARTAP